MRQQLARKAGFRALLNLNTEGEPGQILSPNVEATWAHAFELQHERVSIEVGNLRSEGMYRFLETLQKIGKPVYVHHSSDVRRFSETRDPGDPAPSLDLSLQ